VKTNLLFAAVCMMSVQAFAQGSTATAPSMQAIRPSPFEIVVSTRTVAAVKYEHRSGATKLDFAGTSLMPLASGQAKVESKKGYMEIEVEFAKIQSSKTYGNEYLTYVLWAISPEGRTVNLGEVIVGDNSRSKLDVTTDLQAFALVVTAEPYYAVRRPSNVVVMENVVRSDTKGTPEAVDAKYELLDRGGYIPKGYQFENVIVNSELPLEYAEARNALRIAQSEGAETYAAESYQHAVQLMNQADGYATRKHIEKKPLIAVSREVVQTAEDSRAIAVKRLDKEQLAAERNAAAETQYKTQMAADDATRQKESAQADKAKADISASQAKTEALNSQLDAKDAKADAAASHVALNQAEMDKAAIRTRLTVQLNNILQTRESARGLIVSMSDVLFDTGKFTLKTDAREKLSKIAGILISYPGLKIEVGGNTDNVGGAAMNLELSVNRAGSVRDYLVLQGVSLDSIIAKGYGETTPVANNDTSAGRQQNRRVELLVSGESIGGPISYNIQ